MAIGEVGTLTRGSFGDGEVVRVDFTEAMTDPIIHLSSTNQGGNEFSLRIVSVDANGFNFVLDEWEDEDGPHPAVETINWIAIEEGVHTLADGRIIEAGTTTATDTASGVTFAGGHTDPPVVLTNVMSQNDTDVVDSDPFNVDASGFDVQLQEGSLSDGINTGETVGWIAISEGGDGTAGFASIHDGLGTGNTSFALGGALTDGAVFGETQSINDPDAGNVVLANGASTTGSSGTITAKFDEETGDGESAHPDETVGLVGFELGQILCFTPGTQIDTPHGPREITELREGDLVLTADHGAAPIRHISKTTFLANDLRANPELRPVRIAARSLGCGLPTHDLVVSPHHRMLLSDWKAELLFGRHEVLAPAKGLLNDHSILRDRSKTVTYMHLGFDRHQIIWANGSPSESLHAGMISKGAMHSAAREELFSVFPELRADPANWGQTARPVISVSETKMITRH